MPTSAASRSAPAAPGLADLVSGAQALEDGRSREAQAALQRSASESGPLRDLAWLLLGRAALKNGEIERALAAATLAPDAVPGSVRRADADWLQAEAFQALERHDDAAGAWARAQVMNPAKSLRVRSRCSRHRRRAARGTGAIRTPIQPRVMAIPRPTLSPSGITTRAIIFCC